MFRLVLTNGADDLFLDFKIKRTVIAHKWFKELKQNYPLYETDRFTNWGNNNLIKELNKHIDIVNNYDNIIDKKADINIKQKDLNYLHKFFEDLRGEITEETLWYKKSPKKVKSSIQRINVLIHQLEEEIRTKNHPTVTVTFKDRPRHILTKQDIKSFTYRWISGTVYIEYPHVGKPILDVFKDKDDLVEAVRPQTHYSADFTVKFGPTIPYALYLLRKLAITLWLPFQKFKFENPNIGMIPVADLITDVDHKELKKYNKVKEIICNP